MLAAAIVEMLPPLAGASNLHAPELILVGYFIVHLPSTSWRLHFHFGEETIARRC